MRRILIAGIGNIFFGDDAFGVKVAQCLAARTWPEGVRVEDFGIRCLELAYSLLDDWDVAILVDAVGRGSAPGTLYAIDLDQDGEPGRAGPPATGGPAAMTAMDPHTVSVAQVREMAQRMSQQVPGELPRMLLVGCEPGGLEEMGELSAAVAQAVPRAMAMVEAMVEEARREVAA